MVYLRRGVGHKMHLKALAAGFLFLIITSASSLSSELNLADFNQLGHVGSMGNESAASSDNDRNPFGKSDSGSTQGSVGDLKLTGAIWGPGGSACIINHLVLFVGDSIGEFKVLRVSQDGVMLQGERGAKRMLHFATSSS